MPKALPNNDTFCAVFRGLASETAEPSIESGQCIETFGKIMSSMISADVTVGPHVLSYGLGLCLFDGDARSVRPPHALFPEFRWAIRTTCCKTLFQQRSPWSMGTCSSVVCHE